MAHILTIGIAALDIINSVDVYPQEDDEIRAISQDIRRGGNAANSAVILSQLGHQCSWAGVLSDDSDGDFICAELQRYDVDTANSYRISGGKTPTSYITTNRRNGSRTIVHYRDLPEYSLDQFKKIELSGYDWLHFEGRHCLATARMAQLARKQQPQLPISIEIEKSRPGIDRLFTLADLLLYSRAYAQSCGYKDGAKFLQAMENLSPQADLVCAWGSDGAYALEKSSNHQNTSVSFSPAFPPPQLIDTLAAGDTFNAAIIDACCKKLPLNEALTAACRLAGKKCGIEGLHIQV